MTTSPPDDQDNVDARFAELVAGISQDRQDAPAARAEDGQDESGGNRAEGSQVEDLRDGEPHEVSDAVLRGHLLGEPIPHRPYSDRPYPPELDEHFEPPSPPIPTTGNYYTALAWVAIILCPITLFAFMLAGRDIPSLMSLAIVAAFFAACGYLAFRTPLHHDESDNGARL